MSILTIGLAQLLAKGESQEANLAIGEDACRRAGKMGADLVLFPEMWNIGYTSYVDCEDESTNIWRAPGQTLPPYVLDAALLEARGRWQAQAIDGDGPFVNHFQDLARELGIAIAITYLERWPGAPRNTVSLIDWRGDLVLTYAKVHTCDFGSEDALTPGDGFPVCTLDTAAGPVRIGAMICYDREFPESARALMLSGAEIILTPNACEMEANRTGQFRARAYENMVGVALANYAAPQQDGHSCAFSPIAFDDQGSRDPTIIRAGAGEGMYLAPFDLDELRDWRRRETWGNAFRRPAHYQSLAAYEVEPPFVRVNAAGERHDQVRR
ncbi:MAG TPA: carbon-nitrogen hydrolase family protein [Chloroflexota bacterium]|nr:carbon-nitrogen hydrolase family protein [Chloroflexota bacterium]